MTPFSGRVLGGGVALGALIFAAGVSVADLAPRRHRETWPKLDAHIKELWRNPRLVPVEGDLPHPHIIPVVFYWDMYFMNRGLLEYGYTDFARKIADNLLWEVEQWGFVPNASASWGRDRSQPPYLSMIVRDLYEAMPIKDKAWLLRAQTLLQREYRFWTDTGPGTIESHTTSIPGLLRYNHHASDKVLLALYDESLAPRLGLDVKAPTAAKLRAANHRMAEAASGWDFSPRFEGRALDFAAVDLNVNLWVYERNFAWLATELGQEDAARWSAAADARKTVIDRNLWDAKRGLFLDKDTVNGKASTVACLTTFSPLWAGVASPAQAAAVVKNLALFEEPFGLGACEKNPGLGRGYHYQWDHQTAWPHLHMLVVMGLERYGFKAEARRVASKFLDNVAKNFSQPAPARYRTNAEFATKAGEHETKIGTTWEKYSSTTPALNTDEYGVNECLQVGPAAAAYLYRVVGGRPAP